MKGIMFFCCFFLNVAACPPQPIDSLAVRYDKGTLQVLDQQMLPQRSLWIDVKDPRHMVEIIQSLKVRGAPMIGIAAAFCVAQLAENGASECDLIAACEALKLARPTAVNLSIYMQRLIDSISRSDAAKDAAISAAYEIYNEDVELCAKMARYGNALIQDGESILTICNTGSLATAGVGTALGVIKEAHSIGKKIHVYVCETRPLLQGARLTAWELEQAGIPYTLICDSMAGSLMQQGKIDRVLVGADRIAITGDFANKIGTYSLAALAQCHNIPFHVVAPYTTIDPLCSGMDSIVIEQRSCDEVRGAKGAFGSVIWSPLTAPVYNPAFDVTPAELVTSYILDRGVFTSSELFEHITK